MIENGPSFPEWLLARLGRFIVDAVSGISVGLLVAYPMFVIDDLHGLDLWKAYACYGAYLVGVRAMASVLRLVRPVR